VTTEAPKKKKEFLKVMVSPKVKLSWAYLTKVDEKFKKYSVTGELDPSDPEHKAFLDKLEAETKEAMGKLLAAVEEPARREYIKKTYKLTSPVATQLVDYKPTGRYTIKPKAKAEKPPGVCTTVDGQVVATSRIVWTGSEGKIKMLLNPYICDAQKTYGLSLLLEAVQVTRFADAPSGVGGKFSGFDPDENTGTSCGEDSEGPPPDGESAAF
jgi:hypothetical protein